MKLYEQDSCRGFMKQLSYRNKKILKQKSDSDAAADTHVAWYPHALKWTKSWERYCRCEVVYRYGSSLRNSPNAESATHTNVLMFGINISQKQNVEFGRGWNNLEWSLSRPTQQFRSSFWDELQMLVNIAAITIEYY